MCSWCAGEPGPTPYDEPETDICLSCSVELPVDKLIDVKEGEFCPRCMRQEAR